MKKQMTAAVLSAAAVMMFSGCAKTIGSPAFGLLIDSTKGPGSAATPHQMIKTGTSSCHSFLGLIATGDCSISTAARGAGITKVATVDFDVNTVLGIYSTTKIIVTGE
jgi:hypothetical protein